MSRTARLFQIMQVLRRMPPPVRADSIAEETGVSLRTIYRDIDTLRGLGAVIDGAAGFGFTLIEDAALPPLGFEDEELEALVLGLREVQQIGDRDLAKAAGDAMAKLRARLPARQAQRLEHAVLAARRNVPPAAASVSLRDVRRAAWEERMIAFDYADAKGARSHRTVKPLSLAYLDRSTVLLSWCDMRKAFRAFRVDRMENLIVTDISFRPERVALLRAALAEIRAQYEPAAKLSGYAG